jgi:putative phage-type endonuclease
MIIETFEQGSEEWFQARAGIPTASNFKKIVTSKGDLSKSANDYMYQLAGERIAGSSIELYKSAAMERGNELEAEARSFLSLTQGVEIKEVGMCYPDDKKAYSCSPDGLGDGKGYEIKCPLIHTQVKYLLDNKLPTAYIQQVQGSMAVTGFDEWVFCSYYPGLPDLTLTIERDEAFITKLQIALAQFNAKLDEVTEQLRSR